MRNQSIEANAQLLVAAISAQNLHVTAEQAQHRQSEFLTVQELRSPLAPIHIAAELLGYLGYDPAQLRDVQIIIERQVKARVCSMICSMSRA